MVVDFFLAAFTFKGLFLVFVARLFFITSPMPIFFELFLARFFFLGDWATSFMLLEEGLLEFSIFDVQGADKLTCVFCEGQRW